MNNIRMDVDKLGQSEDVILSIQEHWIWLLRPVFFLLLGGILGFIFFRAGQLAAPTSEMFQFLFHLLAFVVLTVSVHFFFILIFQWVISNIIITDKRIVEIRYAPFVIDDINHIEMTKINDVEKTKHGVLKNLLNYGEVNMSVAGMKNNVSFQYIRRPSKFVNLIEAVKLNKPLENLDLHGIGANFSPKYSFLKK